MFCCSLFNFTNLVINLNIITIQSDECVLLQEGMGSVRIVEGGLEVNGDSYILGNLVASSIRSRPNRPISIRAAHNISIISNQNHASNSITLGKTCLHLKISNYFIFYYIIGLFIVLIALSLTPLACNIFLKNNYYQGELSLPNYFFINLNLWLFENRIIQVGTKHYLIRWNSFFFILFI